MDTRQSRTVGGVALLGGATLMVLGFITSQALYSGYSTSAQTISALGAGSAPAPSQAVFNATMVASGVVLLGGAYSLDQVYAHRWFSGLFAVTSIGISGVGLFPTDTGLLHFVAAAVAFGGVGLLALGATTLVRGPFAYVSATLGVLELLSFVLFVALGDATFLGIGGLERFVAYLGLLWATAFGGFLLGEIPRSP